MDGVLVTHSNNGIPHHEGMLHSAVERKLGNVCAVLLILNIALCLRLRHK
jgi:hypothetical protein